MATLQERSDQRQVPQDTNEEERQTDEKERKRSGNEVGAIPPCSSDSNCQNHHDQDYQVEKVKSTILSKQEYDGYFMVQVSETYGGRNDYISRRYYIPADEYRRVSFRKILNFIDESYTNHSHDHEVMKERFEMQIRKFNLDTLTTEEPKCVDNHVVDFYFKLIEERSREYDWLPKVYVFSHFFYIKMTTSSQCYKEVFRWTSNVNIFRFNYVFMPVGNPVHWTLIVIDMRKKLISYYDSMGGGQANAGGYHHRRNVLKYLKDEYERKTSSQFPTEWESNLKNDNVSQWTMNAQVPQQNNGYDCGIYICLFAEYISRQCSFDFSQRNIPYFRKRIMYEVLQCKLLPPQAEVRPAIVQAPPDSPSSDSDLPLCVLI